MQASLSCGGVVDAETHSEKPSRATMRRTAKSPRTPPAGSSDTGPANATAPVPSHDTRFAISVNARITETGLAVDAIARGLIRDRRITRAKKA